MLLADADFWEMGNLDCRGRHVGDPLETDSDSPWRDDGADLSATSTHLRLLGDDPVKICLDRQGVCVYNKRNFTEGDEGEANYGSFQRTAGWCEAAGL